MNFPTVHVFNTTLAEQFIPEAKKIICMLDEKDISAFINNMTSQDPDRALALISVHENITVQEAIVKHVDSRGQITRTKDLATRKRLATQTTGLSKAKRREIARRATKTKKASPSTQTKALKKRKKALKKRKSFGL